MSGETLIVAHDSGGAEIVSAWVATHTARRYRFLLAGPAAHVFRRKFPQAKLLGIDELEAVVTGAEFVLTGTGWGSDLEKRAIECALRRQVPVAAYLDHWVNYRSRFELGGSFLHPDEIWVGDEFALAIARATFPDATLKLEPNQYFEEMRRQCAQAEASRCADSRPGVAILYVTQPTSTAAQQAHGDPLYWGYTEFDALEGYLRYLRERGTEVSRILIRFHPSEAAGKYDHLVEKYRTHFNIVAGSSRTLAEDCAQADWVVGCDSMALVVGLIAGKQVFSSLPPGAPPLSLPYPDICRLFQ